MNGGESPVTSKNLNTILLGIALAALSFVSATSFSNSVSLGEIKASQITRAELDTRLAEVRNEQMKLGQEQVSLKMEMVKLEQRMQPAIQAPARR